MAVGSNRAEMLVAAAAAAVVGVGLEQVASLFSAPARPEAAAVSYSVFLPACSIQYQSFKKNRPTLF